MMMKTDIMVAAVNRITVANMCEKKSCQRRGTVSSLCRDPTSCSHTLLAPFPPPPRASRSLPHLVHRGHQKGRTDPSAGGSVTMRAFVWGLFAASSMTGTTMVSMSAAMRPIWVLSSMSAAFESVDGESPRVKSRPFKKLTSACSTALRGTDTLGRANCLSFIGSENSKSSDLTVVTLRTRSPSGEGSSSVGIGVCVGVLLCFDPNSAN